LMVKKMMVKKMKRNNISIGTRGSRLALLQAEWVRSELTRRYPYLEIELTKIKTKGDKILDVPLAKVGGKGLFVKEIEEAILRGEVDMAVHSIKDLPADLPKGLHIAAICEREDPRDALLIRRNLELKTDNPLQTDSIFLTHHSLLHDLPEGARVGTSSLRRMCQLLHLRPDLKISQSRGNIDTRVRKLDEGLFDAIVVAVAGLKRLGWAERITEILKPEVSLPAIGQGAIGIECRTDDEFTNSLVSALNHRKTSLCVRAERAFLKKLEGGCQVPIAAYARIVSHESEKDKLLSLITHRLSLIIDGLVGSVTGGRVVRGRRKGRPEEAEALGIELAEDMLTRGAQQILTEVYPVF